MKKQQASGGRGQSEVRKAGRPARRSARQPSGRVTIHDVAARARVSVATVSRALQSPGIVAEDSRRKVLAAVAKLGYSPNVQARSLRTARTHTIVALVPDISNPFYSAVIRGIERVAHQNQYSVLLGDTQHSVEREQSYAELISRRQADGLITLAPRVPVISHTGRAPVVNACEYVKDPAIASVHIDNARAAREALVHLINLGHRDIAFIAGREHTPISADRERGYRQALEAAGLPVNPELVAQGDFSVESGVRAMEQLYAAEQPFTAVFCSNDEMAIGALQVIKGRGQRIPEDVSVIGFDDIPHARYTDPPLTTIAQPMAELGMEAMTMLLEILQDPTTRPRKRILPAPLVIRASAGRCRRSTARS